MEDIKDNANEVVTEVVDPKAIYQHERATIDIQIATAKQYPRNIEKIVQTLLTAVTADVETAMSCTYSKPIGGGKTASGPSVGLARLLLQQWGNLRSESRVVKTDDTKIIAEATVFDLETNNAVRVQSTRSIIGSRGRFSESAITANEGGACAVALRRAVFDIVPRQIVNKIYSAAINAITGNISSETELIAKRTLLFNNVKASLGVTEVEILSALNRVSVNYVTRDDIIVLVGLVNSIKNGEATVDQTFKKVEKANGPEEVAIGFLENATTKEQLVASLGKYAGSKNASQAFKDLYEQKLKSFEK